MESNQNQNLSKYMIDMEFNPEYENQQIEADVINNQVEELF